MRRLLSFNLEQAGFEVDSAASAGEALEQLATRAPRVVLLDLMLPDQSGFEVCRRIRNAAATAEVGIIIVSAREDEYDRIVGLEVGADDYVTKPFSMRELILRTQALCKRIAGTGDDDSADGDGPRVLRLRDLELNLRTVEVTRAGEPLELRPLELRLLAAFMQEPGRVLSRDQLLAEVWGLRGVGSRRTVDVHVNRLRVKLGESAGVIETVQGFGYRGARD